MKLQIKNLNKNYGNNEVLKNLTFEFEQGKIYALLGRNGIGKTTFFNCISEDIKFKSGQILLIQSNEEISDLQNKIGYVLSTPILPEFLTGYEFVKFYVDINKDQIKEPISIDEYFNIVQINETDRHKLIKDFSHGMKNKIQMLMFIISKPAIILLDEPLTSIDPIVSSDIKKILLKMRKDHIIIFSTHILELAKELCDEIVILNNGKMKLIDNNLLSDKDFEDRIVSLLKEGV